MFHHDGTTSTTWETQLFRAISEGDSLAMKIFMMSGWGKSKTLAGRLFARDKMLRRIDYVVPVVSSW